MPRERGFESGRLWGRRAPGFQRAAAICLALLIIIPLIAIPLFAIPPFSREKNSSQYGVGLIINIPSPVDEVNEAVADVVGNGIIRGTKEYNKDEYISGAVAATSTPVFPTWKEPGKVFYKVRKAALNPWNFKDSADAGTIAVRYVVQPQGQKNSILRIDALYVEDFRHTVHQSNGSVETSEFKDIQDHLAQMELMKKETEEAVKAKQEHIANKEFDLDSNTELLSTPSASSLAESSSRADNTGTAGQTHFGKSGVTSASESVLAEDPNETPEQRAARLRREVERIVKRPGAPLKSAPFHTATTVKTLDPGTEVLVVILTPYWLGVETHEGEHGWIKRDELEQAP